MRKPRRRDILFQTPGHDYAGGVGLGQIENGPAIGLKDPKALRSLGFPNPGLPVPGPGLSAENNA